MAGRFDGSWLRGWEVHPRDGDGPLREARRGEPVAEAWLGAADDRLDVLCGTCRG